ncbi:hypothetical protein KQI52_13425 [bacterium]|nr:hypothetical protein [bacterium]
MKSTAYSTRMYWSGRSKAAMPVREFGLTLPLVLLALILFGFFASMIHLQVQKTHFGALITTQTDRVETLRAEVRALNGQIASLTSLDAIRERALERGMTEPKAPPPVLQVTLTSDEISRMGGVEKSDVAGLLARSWSGEAVGEIQGVRP